MQYVAFDFETHPIAQGLQSPPAVCLSWYDGPGSAAGIMHALDPLCEDLVRQWLFNDDVVLVGQNVVFDLSIIVSEWPGLLDGVFRKLDLGLVRCTRIRQKLIDIANGQYRGYVNGLTGKFIEHKYGLADLSLRLLGRDISAGKGPDAWRMRYAELEAVPISEWPQDAIDYPLSDAMTTYYVFEVQERSSHLLEDEPNQVRADFALRLMSCYGIRTDESRVRKWESVVQGRLDKYRDMLIEAGLIEADKRTGLYKKKVKKAQEYAIKLWEARGVEDFPKTDGGKPSLDADAAKRANDPLITAFQAYSSAGTIMSRVKELWGGIELPIHTQFDVLMDTGRTSSTKPNIQNRAREPGDRECFVPRERFVFMVADLDGFELRTIAQSCLWAVGYSKLAEVLNAGEDPHLMMAATMLRISYDEAKTRYEQGDPEVEDARGARNAKMANFGFPAGLGVKGFIGHAQESGFEFTEEEARKLYEDYLTTWPEMRAYFAWIRGQMGQTDLATVKHFKSNRYRGLIPYTVACNTFSQGLGADAAKYALYKLVKTCYTDQSSILYGCRPVNFIHDEYMVESPDDEFAHDRAHAMAKLITDSANEWLPDVPTRAKPLLSRRWSKLAKAKYDSSGRLVPWDDEP